MLKQKLKGNRGITLIALVITIIVLLILAGVSIAMLTGENGILTQAQRAKSETENAAENEVAILDEYNDYLNDAIGEGTIKVGKVSGYQGTINGQAGTYQNPTIPKGYIPINEGEAIWDGESGPAYNKGLVITDVAENGNEWVWVPVAPEEASAMYVESTSGVALTGSTGEKTNKYSASGIISGSYGTRVLPGDTSSYREPDLVLGSGTEYDYSNYGTAGFTSLQNMAQTMVSEYNTMIESIKTYGGFYIGRYELTANGEKPGATLTETSWYNLYAKCKELAKANSNTITRMIWGCQWDVTCNWLATNGYDINDSSSWGNYSNNTVEGHGEKQNTGFSESWKANNIYDFAGNCWEWTQEANNAYNRVYRGGSYSKAGSSEPATVRYYGYPTYDNYSYNGSRPTLILNP